MDEDNRGEPLPGWLVAGALALLAAWTFRDRWQFLTATPYPTGVDGYWYAVQLRSILGGDGLYYPAAPLALWLMAPLAALAGPFTGAKLGAALASAALPLAVYPLGRRIGGSRAAGLLSAVLVATSAGSFYLATEFVKNAVALPIGMAALVATARALERPSRRRAALAAALVAATGLAHALVLALVLVAAAPPLAAVLLERGRVRALAIAGAAGAAGAGLLAWWQADLLGGLFSPEADWALPALRLGGRALLFRHEVAVAGAVSLAALVAVALARWVGALASQAPLRDRAFGLGPAAWAVLFALPWIDAGDPDGLAFRVRLLSFAPLALAAPLLAAHALARLDATWRMTVVMLATGIALYRPGRYEAPVVRADPDLAAAVAAAKGRVPAGDMIVSPERHLVFMTVWYTGVEARLDPESVPPARRWRLIPMSYMSESLVRALDDARAGEDVAPPISLHRGNRNGLVLLREPTWQWVLARLPAPEAETYRRWPVH
ncbi:MAG TPA: glycosyltransferase family 39 protein [Kofleriaceae bacterium]|nr:glycosyltransferase family 39 protein [Kofleriaceae bacterium]